MIHKCKLKRKNQIQLVDLQIRNHVRCSFISRLMTCCIIKQNSTYKLPQLQ